jgi:hypothetical protein
MVLTKLKTAKQTAINNIAEVLGACAGRGIQTVTLFNLRMRMKVMRTAAVTRGAHAVHLI